MVAHETAFQADLDGDGVIGLKLVSKETNGNYELATSHNKYYIIDISDSSIVTSFDSSNMGDGWSATQVEASASGGFEVFWSHSDGKTTAHKISDTGVYQSTITRTIDQHETAFQVDLDGDGVIGLNLVSRETNGSYELATSNNKYYIIDISDSSIVTSFDGSNMGDGWSATQVEASASGGFEVFWSHSDGKTTAHKISDTGVYQSTITRTIDQHETAFQVDLDGDGVIGLNLVSIETNGSYKLATSNNKYKIIDSNDSIVASFGNSNRSDGWSITQVEEGSESGTFEIFWSNINGRSAVYNVNEKGEILSTITRTKDQHETAFQADLDGDNVIGLNLVSIETNGSYKLATSNNKYKIIDSNDSIVASFGNSNRSDGWSITQVEEGSESGAFEVFWSNINGRSVVYNVNEKGVYQSMITREMLAHETVFKADLDGDGLTTIKTNGDFKIIGGSGNDRINGGTGDDILDGGAGNDILNGGDGDDTLIGGIGDDSYSYAYDGVTTISDTSGIDTLFITSRKLGENSPDKWQHGGYFLGNDLIISSQLDSPDKLIIKEGKISSNKVEKLTYIYLNDSSDTFYSSYSMKIADIGEISDTESLLYFGTLGNDNITTGDAYAEVYSYDGDDTIILGNSGGWSRGGRGNDNISAGSGEHHLRGHEGDDTLDGGAGNDTLEGGTGKDIITTGSGSDTIYLRAGDGGNELSDADIITDFTDGSDDFGLTTSLSFGDLTRTQGSGDYANDTIIKYGSEYLAILQNIDVSLLTEADFEDVDFA